MKITDVATAVDSKAIQEEVGIRPGEKLHEQMIGEEDEPLTFEYNNHFKILPAINGWGYDPLRIKTGKKVSPDFTYNSATNNSWMTKEELRYWLEKNNEKLELTVFSFFQKKSKIFRKEVFCEFTIKNI